jgi:8-oxo-dGTP diphosphatase
MLNESNPRAVKKFQQDSEYFQIGVSIDCVILGYEKGRLKVLLIQCKLKEYEGLSSLLGDILQPEEDIDEASYRILRDRTGLDDVFLEQVQTFGSVKRHPGGRVITVAYYSLINILDHQMQLSDNDLNWHLVNDLKQMAFDHKKILDTTLSKLRNRVMEEPIIFNLLPKKFSLRELQSVYEAILGSKLDRRNFRKKIFLTDWLIDLDEFETGVTHRPGKLYAFNFQKFLQK